MYIKLLVSFWFVLIFALHFVFDIEKVRVSHVPQHRMPYITKASAMQDIPSAATNCSLNLLNKN